MFSGQTKLTPCSIRWTWACGFSREQYYGEPHTKEVFWLEVCRYPLLLDAVEAILGPNLILVYSSMFIKLPTMEPAWVGTRTTTTGPASTAPMWPQCGWRSTTRTLKTPPCASYPVHTEATGSWKPCLRKSEMLKKNPEMEAQAVMMEMQAGSLSIHDSYIRTAA